MASDIKFWNFFSLEMKNAYDVFSSMNGIRIFFNIKKVSIIINVLRLMLLVFPSASVCYQDVNKLSLDICYDINGDETLFSLFRGTRSSLMSFSLN